MKKQFTSFTDNIRLTTSQESDAQTKYNNVCKTLHKHYYSSEYDGKTKFLFGSYKMKTNTRPLTPDQDVDVLFKLPQDVFQKFKDYKSNGPAALLQEIRTILSSTFSTTDRIKGWGKVVLVEFAEGKHNVELLPAFENEDGTFTIPNSENGGTWEIFDPKKQIEDFLESNKTTEGLTVDLTRIIKTWRDNTSISKQYSSYILLKDVMGFLNENSNPKLDYEQMAQRVLEFFEYAKSKIDSGLKSHVETAINRAQKAINFATEGKLRLASEEWRKIFGNEFPLATDEAVNEVKTRVFSNPALPYASH